MNISDMLNPSSSVDMLSPPMSPNNLQSYSSPSNVEASNGKPRSRFSDLEDAIICDGVSKGLTWGQISNQLPHRKRATCFNRYRTLQGIRKSRKRSSSHSTAHMMEKKYSTASSSSSSSSVTSGNMLPHSPHSPRTPAVVTPVLSPSCSSAWTPTTPPSDLFLSSYPMHSNENPLIRRLSISSACKDRTLPPIFYPIAQHHHHFQEQQHHHRPYFV